MVEKARLVAEGKIKKSKPLVIINKHEESDKLPNNWIWALMSQAVSNEKYSIKRGPFGSAIKKSFFVSSGYKVYEQQHAINDNFDLGHYYLNEDKFNELKAFAIKPKDIIISCSGTVGKVAIAPSWMEPGIINQALLKLTLNENILTNAYFKILFPAFFMKTETLSDLKGTAQKNMVSVDQLKNEPFPLPPLAEQHRIVAKVDELMALCDQLENQHNNAAVAHEKLVTHLLGTLTQSQNAEDFNTNWQRISEHFDTLFTTEASIDALKQTLLQLAVMGKLVPQEPNDEPASELLKRIQAEKAKLIAEGKIKKSKPLAPISDEEKPFELPIGWEWARLSELIAGMDSGWSPACLENKSPSDNVWGVLKTTAVQIMQYLEQENKELPDKLTPRPEAEAKVGDILFTRAGPTNRVAISCLVEATRKNLMISDKIIRFHPIETGIDGHFLVLCLNTGATAAYLEKAKSGMAASQVNISQEKLHSAPIPLPPLKIQKLIVSKVVEMTAICDHLKGRFTESNELQQKLADTLVEQAI